MSATPSQFKGDLQISTRDDQSGGDLTVDGSLTVGETDFCDKADKVASPTAGNLAALDASGNLTDSGSAASDFADADHSHGAADITSGVVSAERLPAATETQPGILAVCMDNGLTADSGVLDISISYLSEIFSRTNHYHNKLKYGSTEYFVPDCPLVGGRFLASAKTIASDFDDETAYAVGDYVSHYGNLFRCTTAHPAGHTGNWNADHFTSVKVMDLVPRPLRQKTETTSGTVTLTDDVSVYSLSPSGTTAVTFVTGALGGTGLITFELLICMPQAAVTIDFSGVSLSWLNDDTPDLSAGGKSYLLVFRSFDNGTSWVGNLQGYW